ncbi:unnamed protein product, partial [Aureobasidium vineae]
MNSPMPPGDADKVVQIDLSSYGHTGTGYKPTGDDYIFPEPDTFLKSLSKAFNKQLSIDPRLKEEFNQTYHGAQVEFTALPTGYTVTKKIRDDKRQDYEIHGHFSGIGSFDSAPQFLKHAMGIMRLHLVDWLELREEHLTKPDGLECECVLCKRKTAEQTWIQKKVDREGKGGSLGVVFEDEVD